MARAKIAVWLLLGVLAATLVSSWIVRRAFDTTEQQMLEVVQLCEEGRCERAREKLDELTDKLQSKEHMLALFIRRDMLGQIQLEVAGLRAYLDEEHIADLQCEAEHALAQLQAVRHLFFSII